MPFPHSGNIYGAPAVCQGHGHYSRLWPLSISDSPPPFLAGRVPNNSLLPFSVELHARHGDTFSISCDGCSPSKSFFLFFFLTNFCRIVRGMWPISGQWNMKGDHVGRGHFGELTVGQEKSLSFWWILFPCQTVRAIVRQWQSRNRGVKICHGMTSPRYWINSGSSELPDRWDNKWPYCWRRRIGFSVAHNQKDSSRCRCSINSDARIDGSVPDQVGPWRVRPPCSFLKKIFIEI